MITPEERRAALIQARDEADQHLEAILAHLDEGIANAEARAEAADDPFVAHCYRQQAAGPRRMREMELRAADAHKASLSHQIAALEAEGVGGVLLTPPEGPA
jgi:hypothetical protein